jgi:hypothetical protein
MAYLRQLALLGGSTLFGFALYVLLFWAGAGLSITILFYRGVALALLVAVLVGAAAYWLERGRNDSSLPIAATALSLSFNLCFLVLLPVTVDRSVTVYLLSTIERERGIKAPELERALIEGYVIRLGAVERRIDEQLKSGNVRVAPNGRIELTDRGRRFMTASRGIAKLFGTDQRFVNANVAASCKRSCAH